MIAVMITSMGTGALIALVTSFAVGRKRYAEGFSDGRAFAVTYIDAWWMVQLQDIGLGQHVQPVFARAAALRKNGE